MGMAIVAATWGTSLALRFKTQSAAPLMQAGMFLAVLLHDRLRPARPAHGLASGGRARINPVTQVVEAARQGFVGDVTWAETWPGFVALVGLARSSRCFALRGMNRMTTT